MTLLAGAAAMTALLASGCGAGQIAETAEQVPAVPGANGHVDVPGGSVSVRNAMVVYHAGGYEKSEDAPLDLRIFNDTGQAVTVTVTTESAETATIVTGAKGTPSPSASPTPSASASATPTASATATPTASAETTPTAEPTPSEAPARPATIEIPAGSFAVLDPSATQFVQLIGLKEELTGGRSVKLVFEVAGARMELEVPLGVPLTPVPRGSAEPGEGEH
jgi:hypothetical protein